MFEVPNLVQNYVHHSGRLFVVGDLHGCYELLMNQLTNLQFNFEQDLLVSVGDLVDRGPDSLKCLNLIDAPWFKAVLGNHEEMCLQSHVDHSMARLHAQHGGEWFYELPEQVMEAVGRRLNQLPVLLEVKYKGKKFGFVHADLPVQDWELAKEMLEQGDYIGDRSFEDYLLWSRGIIDNYENFGKVVDIAQVDNVFLGHTVLKEVTQVGNCTFLDTGGVFQKFDNGYKLSVVKLSDYC